MDTINYSNPNVDQTVRIFDKFYSYETFVPAAEYDIVLSFFKEQMDNPQAAGNFTVSLFQVAEQTNIPALTLLDGFQGQTTMDISLNMAYYLNNIRSRATLLGVNSQVVPNFYAARLVLQ
jgi:pyruvate/2-oxoacid:ferredoxin oxidoreductase alpha subunit